MKVDLEVGGHRVNGCVIEDPKVYQSRGGIERHGVPVVGALRRRHYNFRVFELPDCIILNGPPGGIDAGGPIDRGNGVRRNERTFLSVEDIEKSVFVRLHHDTALLAVDGKSGQHQRLRRVVVPIVSRRCLIVPDLFAVVGSERDDGSDVEIIALASQPVVPRRCVSCAEVYEVEFWIVHHRVPHASTTAGLPPLT